MSPAAAAANKSDIYMGKSIIKVLQYCCPLLLAGCSAVPAPEPEESMSLPRTVLMTGRNMAEIRLEDDCRATVNEYKHSHLLLNIPGYAARYKSMRTLPPEALAESRRMLEKALQYLRALSVADGNQARSLVAERSIQKLHLEAAGCALKYDSALKQKNMLNAVEDPSGEELRLQKQAVRRLEDISMELRMLAGLAPGSAFHWTPAGAPPPVPSPETALRTALHCRPELKESRIPYEALQTLAGMMPPESEHPEIEVMTAAERILRFPVLREQRLIFERHTPPEAAALIMALGIQKEIVSDLAAVKRAGAALADAEKSGGSIASRLKKEEAALQYHLAVQRLYTDMGLDTGGALPELPPDVPADAGWLKAAEIAATMYTGS